MSSNKRGSGADALYENHLFGEYMRYKPNAAVRREQSIAYMLERIITNLAVSRFEWKNLPKSMNPRFIELVLFYQALAVVYKDRDYDKILAVRGSGQGFINAFDDPVNFTVIAPGPANRDAVTGGYGNKTIKAYDASRHEGLDDIDPKEFCVPIWANPLRVPDLDIVKIYASRLAMIDRTIEINTKNSRRPKVIKTSEQAQLSHVNIARGIDQGDELLQITGPAQDMEFLEALDLAIDPKSHEAIHILRTRQWNECMGLLGIDNANQDKKERLVAAEVGANDDQSASMREVSLMTRRQAAETINEIFDENIKVNFRVEVEAEAKQAEAATNPGMPQLKAVGDE